MTFDDTKTREETGFATPPVTLSGIPAVEEAYPQVEPPSKNLLQLMNISIGFLGIQFAWALQMGQMSPLLEKLGSVAWITSLIWAAGPVTGILVQPIVGAWSDRTWTFLGRRRPFLLAGVLLTAISLILMPNSPTLLIAAILLWILDASINVSQGPYRALVPDVVSKKQQALTYSLMSFTIGLGSVLAFFMASNITDVRRLLNTWNEQLSLPLLSMMQSIPDLHFLFYCGALAIVVAMGWTILTTKEDKRIHVVSEETAGKGFGGFIHHTVDSIKSMPLEIKKLCLMHSFTWFGLQCLFIFFTLYVAHNLYGEHDPQSPVYQTAIQNASWCYFLLNLVCFLVSPLLGKLCEWFSEKAVHTVGLLCLGGGLISAFFLKDINQAMIAMSVIGIGWATTLSVPWSILAKKVPVGKEGILMGTFNIFIAAPQLVASTLAGVLVTMTHNDATALVLGGISVVISAFLLQWVKT